ncbi:MAG: sialidase family protein [Bryobacteraceae bacterium]
MFDYQLDHITTAFAALRFYVKLLTLSTTLLLAAPSFEQSPVFESGKDGYAMYRIPGIVVTKKGTLLAYAEARKKSARDWGFIDIVLKRSTDGGRTWSQPMYPAKVEGPLTQNPVNNANKIAEPGDITYNNPMLIADPKSGVVHFLFCIEYMRAFYMRSTDDGVTFSKPVEITKSFEGFRKNLDWKVLALGPGHGIMLRNGRLLVPVWIALGTGTNAHGDAQASVIYSDDRGATWKAGDIAVPNTPEFDSPGETAAVELADGRVMLNTRNGGKANRRAINISPNGATNWSKPYFDNALWEPRCMASLVRLSTKKTGGRDRILFSNPYNLDRADGKAEPGASRDRKNVSVLLSYDEGQTWAVRKTVEPSWSGYSDLAVANDGTILLLYERGDPKDTRFRPASLTLARFNLEWLSDGKDALKR